MNYYKVNPTNLITHNCMRLLYCLLFSVFLFSISTASSASYSCMDNDGTQWKLNECADMEFGKVDKELNAIYQKILTEYTGDHEFITKLKAAQRAWLKFRDAEMEALFPLQEKGVHYGSVYPMCHSIWLANLTQDRITQLKKWTEKVEEGDVCAGSIRTK